jgi:HSP20 family protein
MPLPTMRSAITGDLDTVFDRFLNDWNLPLAFELPTAPSIDFYEKDGTFYAEIAVPGYKPEDIEVETTGNILTIVGKYDTTKKLDEAKYHRREIRRGAFQRSVTLPLEIDPATVTAKVERGILLVTAKPMKAAANTKVKVTGT